MNIFIVISNEDVDRLCEQLEVIGRQMADPTFFDKLKDVFGNTPFGPFIENFSPVKIEAIDKFCPICSKKWEDHDQETYINHKEEAGTAHFTGSISP